MIECKYGHFTDDGREYVITNVETPRPWINVISNSDYSMLVSQTGGGYSFRDNAEQNRLTRSFQDIVKDNWGKYIFVRDTDSKKVWSTSYNPIKQDIEFIEVRHGLGYSIFERKTEGILTRVTMFVTVDKPMELWKVEVINTSNAVRHLDLTTYFEWCMGITPDAHREFQKLFINTSYDKDLKAIVANKHIWGFPDDKGRHNNDTWPYYAFHACSSEVDSYDCDKESFIGMYNDEATAAAHTQDKLARNVGRFGDPVGCLRVKLTLEVGQSRTIVFGLGMAKMQGEDYKQLIKDNVNVEQCDIELDKVKKFWSDLVDNEQVNTPDKSLNLMTNVWSKYQAISCRIWAKAAYYQISGGFGYRDQLQDSLIFLESAPQLTRQQLLLHATKQFQMGDVQHWWVTVKSFGPRTKCSDDFLWLPYITQEYINETQDYSIYDEVCPYVDGGTPSTFYQHCKRSIELSLSRFSDRGIPLMGDHDWNDGLSAVGNMMKGESFWVAEFLYLIASDFIHIATRFNDNEFAQLLQGRMQKLKSDFNKYGWDGKWFVQATNDDGDILGSHTNEEGKIFLNPQLWAVISGITDEQRKKSAMQTVSDNLLKKYGAVLLTPEYTAPHTNIGYITRYAPGLRENGGVYSHAATWAVWAYALMGDRVNTYEAYKRICPPNRSGDIDSYKAEPYVMPGNTDGPISPNYGRGGWTWYTGSAQWLHRVAVNWLLGIRATAEGLLVSPSIPDDWQGFEYVRQFRNATYDITINNIVKGGAVSLTVDGSKIEGNVIPVFSSGRHDVIVEIK